jgi:predicted oxidoreductase
MTVSQITLAKDGPTFSRLVFGAWRLADDPKSATISNVLRKIETSLDLGITTFDHADIYGGYTCEHLFGSALAERKELRARMQLVSKCGIQLISPNRTENKIKHYDTSQKHIVNSVENSLRALHTDRLDLLLIHRPDPLMDADEVAQTFVKLKEQGKVLHFGVSNFLPTHFDLLQSRLPFALVTNQIELSVLRMDPLQDGTLDQCMIRGISPMAWSPLGGGLLFSGTSEKTVRVRETLRDIGRELQGASEDQVALAWLLAHPAKIVPVLGTSDAARLQSAAKSEALKLTRQQWFRIWTASAGKEVA